MVEHWPSILGAQGWIAQNRKQDQHSKKLSEPKLSTFYFVPLKFHLKRAHVPNPMFFSP